MAVSTSDVVGLYLAYFGRPPDSAGLQFYTSDPSVDIWSVAASFSASAESQALYGSFGAGQINAIYQNLFNRDADPEGLQYWFDVVNSGKLSPAGAAYAILMGAQNDDKIAIDNKVKVCADFAAQLDTAPEIQGYAGGTAAARARAFIHTVDARSTSVAIAEAFLPTQVAYATGLTTLTFTATKNASNVVTFANTGSALTVSESNGVLTFSTSSGNTGTATVSGTVAGLDVPGGTTLTISAALAGSKVFTGFGATVVVASAAGEDLSAMTATGMDAIQLTSGQSYSLTTEQLALARIGTGGALGNIVDTGKMTVIGALDSVSGTAATALKAAGADLVVGLATTAGDITTKSLTGIDRIDLVSGQDYAVTEAEARLIGLAPGVQHVTIANSAPSGITLAGSVESFQLSNFPGNKVTMGGTAQVVLGGSNADTVTAIDGVTSTSDLKTGANVVIVTAGVDISKGTFSATGGTLTYNVDDAITATMKVAQVNAIGSAEGDQAITLGDAATADWALRADIEKFTLGNFTNSVTMSDVAQVVVGGSGDDTVTAITGVASTNDLKGGDNLVIVTDGADLSKGAFTATGGAISFALDGAATAKLTAAEAARIDSATGTQTVTIANAAASLNLAAEVENFVLGNFTNTVTLKGAGQTVTGGTGIDTVNVGALVATGTLDGGGGASDVLGAGGTLGAATITHFETLNVTADSDISAANAGAALGTTALTMAASTDLAMTVAQNEGLKTSAAVSGTGQSVTLTDAGSTKAIAGIETYVLAAGANTLATNTSGLVVDANALADGDVLTLTGTVAATVKLVDGDLDASGYTTAGLNVIATTGSNVIMTGAGNDVVTGGAGDDTITLGAGSDTVVLNSDVGVDTLTDFTVGAGGDKFNLSKAVFTALGTAGALPSAAFESADGLASAATAAGRIVYDTMTGDLYYDADGSGAGAAVHIATLTGVPALTAANFVVIG
jgi:Ca2+-binding RTX toxin-like protein